MDKINISEITILWSEASVKENLKFDSLEKANIQLHRWAKNAPDNGCYDKTKFKIIFVDNEIYEGRIDLQKKHIYDLNIMGNHIKGYLEFLAGYAQPGHMDDITYHNYIKKYSVDAKKYLSTYNLEEKIN